MASRTFIRTLDPPYQIAAVRYWLSNEQNPTDMQYHYFDAPVDSLDVVAELLDACMFPNGTGILKIQVRDNHAQWSSVIARTLNVTPTGVLAIAGIDRVGSFCPRRAGDIHGHAADRKCRGHKLRLTIPSGNGWDFTPSTGPSIRSPSATWQGISAWWAPMLVLTVFRPHFPSPCHQHGATRNELCLGPAALSPALMWTMPCSP